MPISIHALSADMDPETDLSPSERVNLFVALVAERERRALLQVVRAAEERITPGDQR